MSNELRFVILEKNYTSEPPDDGRYKLLIRFLRIQKNVGRVDDDTHAYGNTRQQIVGQKSVAKLG